MGQSEIHYKSMRRRKTVNLFLGFLQDHVVFYLQIAPFFTRARVLLFSSIFFLFPSWYLSGLSDYYTDVAGLRTFTEHGGARDSGTFCPCSCKIDTGRKKTNRHSNWWHDVLWYSLSLPTPSLSLISLDDLISLSLISLSLISISLISVSLSLSL